MKKAINGFCVISISIIIGSLIVAGKIFPKEENIIYTTQGAANLGKVYEESRKLTIKVIDSDEREITTISDIEPDSYVEAISKSLDESVSTYNEGVSSENKMTKEGARLNKDSIIKLTSTMKYYSEYFPVYRLNLDSKEIHLKKGDLIYQKLIDETKDFVDSQQGNYNGNSFIK